MEKRKPNWYGRHIGGDAGFTLSRLRRLRGLYRRRTELPEAIALNTKQTRLVYGMHRNLEEHVIQEGYGKTNRKISDRILNPDL